MVNLAKEKVQTAIRIFRSELEILKKKLTVDGITLQKLSEILFKMYISDNPEVMKKVKKYADDKKNKKKRYSVTEVEVESIFDFIEENSPLRDVTRATRELEEEEK